MFVIFRNKFNGFCDFYHGTNVGALVNPRQTWQNPLKWTGLYFGNALALVLLAHTFLKGRIHNKQPKLEFTPIINKFFLKKSSKVFSNHH